MDRYTAAHKYAEAVELIIGAGVKLDIARALLQEIIDAHGTPADIAQDARKRLTQITAIREGRRAGPNR